MHKKKKIMKQLLHGFLPILVSIFVLSCSEKTEPEPSERSGPIIRDVSVATAHITDQPRFYDAVGTVRAGISSYLSSKLLGTIEAVRVREGDLVKKGEVLLIIDQRQVNANVHKSEAGLSVAKKAFASAASTRDAASAEEKLALATYKRYLQLKEKNMISLQAFDEVETRYSKAKASLAKAEALMDAAEAGIKEAEATLTAVGVTSKDAVITAPHDGIITGKFVDKGDLASPGTRLLALETTRGFCVDMVLPETYIDHIQPQQQVFVTVPALKTGPLEGTVCTIVPSGDPRSRSFIVKINLPIDLSVRSGMFARVQIPTGVSRKLTINKRAVVSRGQLTGIYLLDDNSIARYRLIRPGKVLGDQLEVLSGLKEGDRYIKEPTPELSDGALVVAQ
ncbi:MAG: efflux RND transporter periplasmic adaptor subunit [Proteobacteria bacterium]|nr:efflux RND transporter periplasmic adaptor subunit [Pseudomonadota bacterium]